MQRKHISAEKPCGTHADNDWSLCVSDIVILKHSIDARKKPQLFQVYTLGVSLKNKTALAELYVGLRIQTAAIPIRLHILCSGVYIGSPLQHNRFVAVQIKTEIRFDKSDRRLELKDLLDSEEVLQKKAAKILSVNMTDVSSCTSPDVGN